LRFAQFHRPDLESFERSNCYPEAKQGIQFNSGWKYINPMVSNFTEVEVTNSKCIFFGI